MAFHEHGISLTWHWIKMAFLKLGIIEYGFSSPWHIINLSLNQHIVS
jgi:hypothetical protein